MAGELPPAIQAFVANMAGYIPALDEGAALAERFGAVNEATAAQVDGAMATMRAATAETIAGQQALFDATTLQTDASKAAADAALVESDMLKLLAQTDVMAADAAKVSADAERVQASAMRTTTAAAKMVGDEQLRTAAKTKTAAKESEVWSKAGGAATAVWDKAKFGLLAVGAAAAYGTDKAIKFDAQMTSLLTQAGVAKNQFNTLSQGVLKLAGEVGQSPGNLAEALYHVESSFASVGITSKKALDMTKVAAEGARLGNANLVDVTNALDAAVVSGIPGVQNLNEAMGVLNATVGSGDMKMQDLADAMGTGMLAVVKGYGISIRDVGAALATFGDNNIRGAAAGTEFRMAIQALAKPAAGGASALRHLGMAQDTLAKDMQKGGLKLAMSDLVDRMNKAGIKANQQGQIITEAFGKKAGTGINILAGQYDRLMSKYPDMEKGAHNFGKANETAGQTAQAKLKQLQGTLQALAVTFGNALLPAIKPMADALQKAFADPTMQKAVSDLGKYLGEVLKQATPLLPVLAKLASQFFAAMGPALPPLAKAISKVADALGKELGKVIVQLAPELPKIATAMGQMALALIPLIPPLGQILIAVIPLVPAIAQLATMFAYVGANLAWFVGALVTTLAAPLKWCAQLFQTLVDKTYAAFKWLYDKLIGHSIIPDLVNGMTKWFTDGMGKVVSAISKGIGDAVNWFGGLPGKILHALGDFGSLLYNAGKNIVQGLINGISSMAGAVGNTVSNIASTIGNFFPHSPAKEGPLSGDGDPYLSGGQIATRLATGMTDNATAVAVASTALAARAAGSIRPGSIAAQEKTLLTQYGSAVKKDHRYEGEESAWLAREKHYKQMADNAAAHHHHNASYLKAEQHAADMAAKYAKLDAQTDQLAASLWSQYQHLAHPAAPKTLSKTELARSQYGAAMSAQNNLAAMRSGPLSAWGGSGFGAGAASNSYGNSVDQHITLTIQLNGTMGALTPQQTGQLTAAVRGGLAQRGMVNPTNGASNPRAL